MNVSYQSVHVASGNFTSEIWTASFWWGKILRVNLLWGFFFSPPKCLNVENVPDYIMISSEIHSQGAGSCHSLMPEGGIRDANKDECNNMWWEMRIPPLNWPTVSLSSERPSGQTEQAHYSSSLLGVSERERERQRISCRYGRIDKRQLFPTLNLGCLWSRWQIQRGQSPVSL